MWLVITIALILIAAIVGILVYRNNQAKADAAIQSAQADVQAVKDKASAVMDAVKK